jgi:hypothetical protein
MRPLTLTTVLLAAVVAAAPGVRAQDSAAHAKGAKKAAKAAKADSLAKPVKPAPFWESTVPFEMTLTINIDQVKKDKNKAKATWHTASVSFADSGKTVTLPARVRARGISRLKICTLIPPLWVDFASTDTKKTAFAHLNRFKLVSPCKPQSVFERYIVEEYNLYRVRALLMPIGHLARLVHMTVVDSASKKPDFTKYAFALEDVDEMAARLGGKKMAIQGATAEDLDPHQTAMVGLFQFMIGNTDFSIYALHNAELISLGGGLYPVDYDFDQAGVIAPPYSVPDPRLGISSVKERLYRGFCLPPDTVTKAIVEITAKKAAVMALYTDDIGKLMGGGANDSMRWFDDVYNDLSNARFVKNDILGKCRDVR